MVAGRSRYTTTTDAMLRPMQPAERAEILVVDVGGRSCREHAKIAHSIVAQHHPQHHTVVRDWAVDANTSVTQAREGPVTISYEAE